MIVADGLPICAVLPHLLVHVHCRRPSGLGLLGLVPGHSGEAWIGLQPASLNPSVGFATPGDNRPVDIPETSGEQPVALQLFGESPAGKAPGETFLAISSRLMAAARISRGPAIQPLACLGILKKRLDEGFSDSLFQDRCLGSMPVSPSKCRTSKPLKRLPMMSEELT